MSTPLESSSSDSSACAADINGRNRSRSSRATAFEFAVSNLFNSPPPEYPRDFHLGFVLERSSDVREVYDRLKGEGVHMKLDLGVQGPALVFQCLGPDNIPVEVRAPKDS